MTMAAMKQIPAFYTTRTLVSFGDGQDLNRVMLDFPDGSVFTLCEIREPRTKEQEQRWRELAKRLTEVWETTP